MSTRWALSANFRRALGAELRWDPSDGAKVLQAATNAFRAAEARVAKAPKP